MKRALEYFVIGLIVGAVGGFFAGLLLAIWVVGRPRPFFGGIPVRSNVVRSTRFSVGAPMS